MQTDNNDKISKGGFIPLLAGISVATLVFVAIVIHFFPSPEQAPVFHSVARTMFSSDSIDWVKPDINSLGNSESDKQIKYGRDLIVNTARYLGPQGGVKRISNGMNCQNCHLDAGTKFLGNNYSAVASTYPKFRARSGSIESVYKRINDCLERSLNGTALDTSSTEMQAMKAYIIWLGKDIPKGKKIKGVGIADLPFMPREADTIRGKYVFEHKCQSCHKSNGEGEWKINVYSYPPLWGPHSYNDGAGLYRLSRLAGYVKYNMPYGVGYLDPLLSDADAWDVAAFVNSQPRPAKDLSHDWPKISTKPVDNPFGPYADTFSAAQHKYGPFGPIEKFKKDHADKKTM
jgi:thiosulfate dehydrogenase